ncbi:MAG: transaldolase [Campylobacterota bacterium]|nr:transaldolase [Campylobacterota bacterium]
MNLKEDINYSIWCDFIERDFLENEFQEIIANGTIFGATSNPAIFQQSISTSVAYEQHINMLQANDVKKIYEELAVSDIKRAGEILKPLYDKNSNDGLVSLEIDPTLCDDMMGSIEEGARLYGQVDINNIMIKVPATKAGYGVMENLTSIGINVNATLVFSPQQAIECAKALSAGIKKSAKDTKAVISVFVSRFDRAMDKEFDVLGLDTSRLGIVNATKCYYEINKFNNTNIRTLFASTAVKGEELPQSYYVDNLIFPNSINTAPLKTIYEWQENGKKEPSDILSEELCNEYFDKLKDNKIDIEKLYNDLLKDGLSAFKVSFQKLLKEIKL